MVLIDLHEHLLGRIWILLARSDDFCPVLERMLTENRTIGRSGKAFIDLASNSTLNNLRFIQRIMRDKKPQRTLEIGLAFGASTLVFCSEHQRIGGSGTKQHTAIDPYQPRHWYDEAGVFAVERAGLGDYLDYRPEFSEFVLPRLLEANQRYDFIYVDGSHLFESVFIDAFYGARLLNDGGLIAFDDSTDPHVAKVILFLRGNMSNALREIRPADIRSSIAWLIGRRQLTLFERLAAEDRVWNTPLREWDSKLARF
jgi:predicted O-methyltransferase YrrM